MMSALMSAISVQLLATLGISISLVYMILMDAKAIYQALRKGELVLFGITCMVFGKDKKYNNKYKKVTPDPDRIAAQVQQGGTKKRLIFIRHGESLWNEVFNRGFHPIKFPLRLVKALLRESTMAFKNDSLFFDSPLNFEGVEQAKNLRRYLANPETYPEYPYSSDVQALRGDANARSAVLVSSILRRATQTIVIVRRRAAAAPSQPFSPRGILALAQALWDRIKQRKEALHILSQLQEISTNVDTLALAEPRTAPELPSIEMQLELERDDDPFEPAHVFNVDANTGNKHVLSTGETRIVEFAEWACERNEEVVIVAGHSLYFRQFFRSFLPHACEHVSKNKKIDNGKRGLARRRLGCLTPQRARRWSDRLRFEQGDLGQR